MATITELPKSAVAYDYIVVGGGTAGCVVAARLAEYLPQKTILLIEGGPSDHGNNRILDLKHIVELWGSDLDYNYTSIEQPFGNSSIVHSRAKVLGGCSSHNGGIAFQPLEYDTRRWEQLGAKGWGFDTINRLVKKLRTTTNPVHPDHQNSVDEAFLQSSQKAFDIPRNDAFNQHIRRYGNLDPSTGFINITYDQKTGYRSSASTAYIHPILEGKEKRPNLTILVNSWVPKINIRNSEAEGVSIKLSSGRTVDVRSRVETILCAGSIDTPRLMLLSGIGPKKQLQDLGIEVKYDLPGVGQNLMDHPETIVMWEMKDELPPNCVNHSEAAIFLRREAMNANGDDGNIPDTLFHMFSLCFDSNISKMGYESPKNAYCMIPNIPRPRSRGRLYLASSDPEVKPAIDFNYLSDPEHYDIDTLVYMVKASRKLAQTAPFRDLIKREIAPGAHVQTDAELEAYNRKAHNTVYHPCGTTKMGNTVTDPLAVVDPELKVKGIGRLRVADAGIFPIITSINPMVTVLAIGERAAELVAQDAPADAGSTNRASKL